MPEATELLEELARVTVAVEKATPDMRQSAKLIGALGPDCVCAKTGMTPLQWAITNDSKLAFHFLLARGADVNMHGTGDYDRAPVDLLVEKGELEKAFTLVRHGAACPPEVAAWRDRQIALREKHEKAMQEIPKRLDKAVKDAAFLAVVARFEETFGVKASKMRGRKGHLTFKTVPVRKLAKAAGEEAELWFARHQAEAERQGAGLFARSIPGESAKDEINIAPTTVKRELICLSNLLPPVTGASPFERMAKADVLDEIDADHPFRLLASGPHGVLGKLDTMPDDLDAFARRLISVCGELHTDYQIQLDGETSGHAPNSPEEMNAIVKRVARDIGEDGMFWLPWGVDH